MPGEEWGRLVGMPSSADVDAALADVKLRAVPMARRNARNRRAISALSALALLGGAFWAGGLNAGNGVRVGAGPRDPRGTGYAGAPELVAGAAAVPASTNRRTMTWRIRTWSDWQGVRFGETEQWVRGPIGTGFALRLGAYSEPFLIGSFSSEFTGDNERISFTSFRRSHFGLSPMKLDLWEEGESSTRLTTARGREILLYPFGRSQDTAVMVVSITGPDLVAPPAVRFDSVTNQGNTSPGLYQGDWAFQPGGFGLSDRIRWARAMGVRKAQVRAGDVVVAPLIFPPPPRVRLGVQAASRSVEFTGRTSKLVIPGLPDTLTGSAYWVPEVDGHGPGVCVDLRKVPWRPANGNWHGIASIVGCLNLGRTVLLASGTGKTVRAEVVPETSR